MPGGVARRLPRFPGCFQAGIPGFQRPGRSFPPKQGGHGTPPAFAGGRYAGPGQAAHVGPGPIAAATSADSAAAGYLLPRWRGGSHWPALRCATGGRSASGAFGEPPFARRAALEARHRSPVKWRGQIPTMRSIRDVGTQLLAQAASPDRRQSRRLARIRSPLPAFERRPIVCGPSRRTLARPTTLRY